MKREISFVIIVSKVVEIMESEKDKRRILVRLFHKAAVQWKLSVNECADLFDKYDVDNYISEAYDFFHVQGDDASIEDIAEYLKNKGAVL